MFMILDYDAIAADDILKIHKYLIYYKMFGFIKKCFLQQ